MAIFDFLKKKEDAPKAGVPVDGHMYTCQKCGKQKTKAEGVFMLEGSTFCCKECCGDPAKGEHKEKKDGVCEFC